MPPLCIHQWKKPSDISNVDLLPLKLSTIECKRKLVQLKWSSTVFMEVELEQTMSELATMEGIRNQGFVILPQCLFSLKSWYECSLGFFKIFIPVSAQLLYSPDAKWLYSIPRDSNWICKMLAHANHNQVNQAMCDFLIWSLAPMCYSLMIWSGMSLKRALTIWCKSLMKTTSILHGQLRMMQEGIFNRSHHLFLWRI